MRIFPSRRLLGATAAWTGAAALSAGLPAIAPAVGAALAGGLALVAWDLRMLARRPAPRVERALPDRAHQGREAQLTLRITNPARAALRGELWEELPADLAAQDPHFADLRVAPGATAELRFGVLPRRRGDRPLGRPVLLERSPLGFLRRRTVGPEDEVLPVFPDTARALRSPSLDPRFLRALFGIKRSRRRGEGMEFESLRDYVPGDDPRRIDWPATARRDRPVTRLHQHERNHVVLVAVDASRLMGARCGDRTKLDHAVDAALALGLAALAHGDRLELVVFDRALRGQVAPRARRQGLGRAVEILRHAQPAPVEADLRPLLGYVSSRRGPRALVVLLTDFAEADPVRLESPLAVLARRHRTLVVALRDPLFQELAPEAPADGGEGLWRRLVLDDLMRERETALARLRRRGALTLDLPPSQVVAPLLDRYLALRYGGDR